MTIAVGARFLFPGTKILARPGWRLRCVAVIAAIFDLGNTLGLAQPWPQHARGRGRPMQRAGGMRRMPGVFEPFVLSCSSSVCSVPSENCKNPLRPLLHALPSLSFTDLCLPGSFGALKLFAIFVLNSTLLYRSFSLVYCVCGSVNLTFPHLVNIGRLPPHRTDLDRSHFLRIIPLRQSRGCDAREFLSPSPSSLLLTQPSVF